MNQDEIDRAFIMQQERDNPKRMIFKTGYLQSLDIVDELIKILKANEILSNFDEDYLEKKIEEVVRSYCKRNGRIPHELEKEQ